MSRQLKTHQSFLQFLHRASPAQRKAIVKCLTNDQLDVLCACAHNILLGNVSISPEQKRRLFRHRHTIRKLASKATSRKAKKAALNQRGGFLGALAATLIPTILGTVLGLRK